MPFGSPWARNFVLQIINLGHEVFVVDLTPNNPKTYLHRTDDFQKESVDGFIQSISGYRINNFKKFSPRWVINGIILLKSAAKSFKPDVLVSLYGGLWGLISYISRVKPLVIYLVGSDILYCKNLKKMITKRILHSSLQVFSNGNYLGEQAKVLAPNVNLKYLYLGINPQRFSSTKKKPVDPIVILCTRGFMNVYNNKYLIDGLNELNLNTISNFKVIFTSAGPLLEEIKEYSQTNLVSPLKEKVEFLGGISDKSLIKLLQESHIYISLSISDGASISLMEALSCELFPILSDIPANREWINNDNGILVPLNDPKRLANAIIRALNDEELRIKAGKYNRELVIRKANSEKNTQVFLYTIQNQVCPK